MRTELRRSRELRQQLETFRPKTGPAKWLQILDEFRCAGVPRSVSITKCVIIYSDMLADAEVSDPDKVGIREALIKMKCCAAYRERIWLNQEKLQEFEAQCRSNDYRDIWSEKWIEDREKNPYPYAQ